MTDDVFFLPRHDQRTLLDLLGQIPALVEDLTIAITRQDRTAHRGPRCTRGDDTQPLPYNENASDAANELHHTLASWSRFTCEGRGIDYEGSNDAVSIARWLRAHVVHLALCEGSEESLDDIRRAIRIGNRVCNGPHDRAVITTSPHDAARTRYSTLHARGLELAARELVYTGATEYRGLSEQRVYRLARAGAITPTSTVMVDGQPCALYLLGDVLDAHVAYPSRQRKVSA
jgi:hypothetical protein